MENKKPENQFQDADTVQSTIVKKDKSFTSSSAKSSDAASHKRPVKPVKDETPKYRVSIFGRTKIKTDEEGREIKVTTKNPIFSVTIAVLYIVLILIASTALSAFLISAANDVFGFVKDEGEVTVTLDMYSTVIDVSDTLEEAGVINYPWLFRMYTRLKLDEGQDFVPGEYTIAKNANYDSLISTFLAVNTVREEVSITIPEGYTTDEIIDLFLANDMGTRDGFVDAIQNGQYDYEFVKRLDENPLPDGRRYRLEGYLFPDTYYFYKDWDEESIINKLLAGFEARFRDEYYAYIDQSGLTLDEYITIASMIQREAYFNTDMEKISSVFHNRLNNPSVYPRLESDATVIYAIGRHISDLTAEDLRFPSPYNTYVSDGLPPSAICNPGSDAIYTAIRPADTDYYFFVSRSNGETLFAKTRREHEENVEEVRREER